MAFDEAEDGQEASAHATLGIISDLGADYAFEATHAICFDDGRVVPVISEEDNNSALYTYTEWSCEVQADYEISEGKITFQGAQVAAHLSEWPSDSEDGMEY